MSYDHRTTVALVSQEQFLNGDKGGRLKPFLDNPDVDLRIYDNADHLAKDLKNEEVLEQWRDENRQLLVISKGRLNSPAGGYGPTFKGVKKLLNEQLANLQKYGINFFANLYSGAPAPYMEGNGSVTKKANDDEYDPNHYQLNSTTNDDILVTSPMDADHEHFSKLLAMFDKMIAKTQTKSDEKE